MNNEHDDSEHPQQGEYILYVAQTFQVAHNGASDANGPIGDTRSAATPPQANNQGQQRTPPDVLNFVQGILSVLGLPPLPSRPSQPNTNPNRPSDGEPPSATPEDPYEDVHMTSPIIQFTDLPAPHSSPPDPADSEMPTLEPLPSISDLPQMPPATSTQPPEFLNSESQEDAEPQDPPDPNTQRWIFDFMIPATRAINRLPTDHPLGPQAEPPPPASEPNLEPPSQAPRTQPPLHFQPPLWTNFADFIRGRPANPTQGGETQTPNAEANPTPLNGTEPAPNAATLNQSAANQPPMGPAIFDIFFGAMPPPDGANPSNPGAPPQNGPQLHAQAHIHIQMATSPSDSETPSEFPPRSFTLPLEALFAFGGLMQPPPERPADYRRARTLLAGIEQVPEGLAKRLEKVDQISGGNGAPCAVCWEPLVLSEDQKAAKQLEIDEDEAKRQREHDLPPGPVVKDFIAALPCTHVFHSECLIPWFARHTTCPSCRFDLDPQSLTLKRPTITPNTRHHPYMRTPGAGTPPVQPEPRPRKWTVPDGKSLRSWVEERERREGLRCDDVSCGSGPCDDDGETKLADGIASFTNRLVCVSPSPLETKACVHRFHPECIVSAARVAGWAVDCDVGDSPVEVSCPVCRAVGTVQREDWQRGVASLS